MYKKEKLGLKSIKSKFNQLSGKKIGSVAKCLAQFAFLPIGKYQAPIFLSFILGVAPATSLLFPTAEEYLEDNNINPDIMEELGVQGKTINVREIGSFAYTVSRFTELPNIPLFILEENRLKRNFGYEDDEKSLKSLRPKFNCQISVQKEEYRPYQEEKRLLGIDLNKLTILHELRHCSDENQALPTIEREVDASYMAIHAMAKIEKNRELTEKKLLYYKALTRINDDGYNIALYADAKINGKPAPTTAEMRRANKKFAEMLKSGCIVLDKNEDALTARRGELFLEAIRFFSKEHAVGLVRTLTIMGINGNKTSSKDMTMKFVDRQELCYQQQMK